MFCFFALLVYYKGFKACLGSFGANISYNHHLGTADAEVLGVFLPPAILKSDLI